MKRKGLRALIAGVLCCVLLGSSLPALAEESKSLDEMTFEELKIAYLELQLEYEKLKNEMASGAQTQEETEEEEAEWIYVSADEFQDDIIASYMARAIVTDSCTDEEKAAMSDEETVAFYQSCVDAETVFYEKYKYAELSDLNLYCLCREYLSAIARQKDACAGYEKTGDMDAFLASWNEGYYERADAVLELTDCYGYIFGDVSSMRENTETERSAEAAAAADALVDEQTVQQVQQMLNEIGFYCGEADGDPGERTIRSIMHFQELFGYEPADGIIDDELISRLSQALAG